MTVHDWTTLKVGLGLDVSGAIVDVSDYLLGSVTRSWGRQSQFDRPRAGRVSFTLDNSDGRFSLDNTSVYASPLREGRAGVFELNGRLVAFRVDSLTPEFADVANVETARVRVSGVDMLGQADAKKIANPLWAMADGQGVTSHFPFSDLAGSTVVANRVEGEPSLIPSGDVSLTFGVAGHSSWSGDQCTVDVAAAGSGSLTGNTGFFGNALIGIETNVYGSVWITPENQTSTAEFFWRLIVAPPTTGYSLTWRLLNSSIQLYNVSTASWDTAATVTEGVAYNVTVGIESGDVVMYVNGELAASYSDFGTSGALGAAGVSFGGAGETSVTLSDLIFTPTRLQVEGLGITTEAERLNALAQMSTTVNLDTLPTGLSDAPIGAWQSSGSMLDAILDVLNTEQGYISCETSGTFDNPVEKIVIRERDRPTTISQTFALTADVLGQPDLKRSISNTLSAVNVTSLTGGTIRVQDATLQELVGDADRTERVELATQNQMLAWGQDRLIRGNPDGIELTSFTVDARTADTDRWADLLGLVAGDRVQVTEFPETHLGFTTRDGWIIGCDESHTRDERSTFKWYLQPVIADLGKYDTARYAADGDLTLSAGINAAVTSMSVATSSVKFTTTDLPQTIAVDDEQMTATEVRSGVNRTNWAQIPSIETDVGIAPIQPAGTMNAGSTLSITSGTGAFGTKYARLTITTPPAVAEGANIFRGRDSGTPSNRIPVTPGEPVSVSFWVRSNIAQRVRPGLQWITSGGTSAGFDAGSDYTLPAHSWTEIVMEGYTAPAATATLRVQLDYGASPIAWATSDVLDADGFLIEKAASLGTYFDGSTSATSQFTYAWTGAVEESTSTETIVGRQFVTVTRGVNGTTAASHLSGAAVEIVPTFVYGF